MATKVKASDHQHQHHHHQLCSTPTENGSLDAMKEQISRLQSELEAERKLTKQLRREKSYDLQKTRELEQTKASIALKDLRTKLHRERTKEQELLKESLARKYELDLQKVVRQKEAELAKLRADLRRCQDELEQTREQVTCLNKCGLSGTSARAAFESERQKLIGDVQELRSARRHLEGELKAASEAEKQRRRELEQVRGQLKTDVAKIQREADAEIKRLLEELKSKDRLAWQKLKETSTQTDPVAAADNLLMVTPPLSPEVAELTNGVKEDGVQETEQGSVTKNDADTKPLESKIPVKKDPGGVLQQKIKELSSRVKQLEEDNMSLAEDKTQLQQKIKEMEKKHRTTLEKNKRFLEKNIEVTNINRSLEEKIKKLTDDLNKLRSQSEKYRKEQNKLSEQLSSEKVEKQTLAELKYELEEMREQTEQQEKTITALKMACSEKDRRIELLVHKKRKQKNSKVQQKMVRFILPAKVQFMANGLKETYYGYDEDTMSIDSEMSSTSCLSSSHLSLDTSNEDDEVFDEVTRSDLEQSYQRLMKEHLELEKSYALLQTKVGASHTDPQRDSKLRSDLENDLLDAQSQIEELKQLVSNQGKDMCWLDEKETMTKTIRMLKDKIKSLEVHERRMTNRISEIQEQNEELEFRILELEEVNEKLKEDINDTITIKDPPQMTDDGVLQMYAEEKGLMEIKLDTVKERLHDLNYSKDGHLDKADKLVLLQARAMLGIADKKLKELTTAKELLKERVKKLEAEKAELLSAATGVSTDLILEYEETRKKLEEAEQKIKEMEETIAKYKEAEAVYKYTEEQNQRVENKYKEEISSLQRKLSNSQEGREYESELWQEQLEKIKNYERRVKQLEAENEPLKEQVELLQIENSHLQCGITQLQCENSRLQCENTQLHSEKTKLMQSAHDESARELKIDEYEKVISEYKQKNTALEDELKSFKEKLEVAKECEVSLNIRIGELDKELKVTTERCCHLENELEKAKVDLVNELNDIGQKDDDNLSLYSGIQVLIKQVHTLMEEKDILQKKADELSEINAKIMEAVNQKEREYDELRSGLDEQKVSGDGENNTEADCGLLDKNRLEEENKSLKEEKNRLEKENTKLKEHNKKLEEENRKLGEDKCKLEQENAKMKDDISRMKGDESGLDVGNQLLEEKKRLEEENKKLKEDNKQVKEEKNRLEIDTKKLKDENNKLQEDKSKHEEDKKKWEEYKKTLEEDNNQLKEKIKKLEEEIEQWKADKDKLQKDNERLQEELEKSKKDAENQIIQLNSQSRMLIEKVKSLEMRLKESQEGELQVKDRIALMEEEKSRHIQNLQSQLEQLEESEAKLYQTINELKEKEEALKRELVEKEKLLNDRMKDMETVAEKDGDKMRNRDELQEKIIYLERREAELLEAVSQLEEDNRLLRHNLEEIKAARVKSVQGQSQTVGLSASTEENVQEAEEELKKEVNNSRKLVDEYKRKVLEYETKCQTLQDDLNVANRRIETLSTEKEKTKLMIKELSDAKEATDARITELQSNELQLKRQYADAKEAVQEKEMALKQLQQELEQVRLTNEELMSKVSELEINDAALRSKLASLESVKNDLLETIKKSAQHSRDCSNQTTQVMPSQSDEQQASADVHQMVSAENLFSSSTDIEELKKMPKEEMVARIHELEQLRASHLKKIKELSDNLSSFRQAVEVVAITLETDSDIPSQSCKSKLRDQDLEQRIRQLCKSELILNLKCMEQEKREAVLRLQLHEAEKTLKKQTKEYRAAIQELEEELDRVRKNEAKLKNKLQYGGWNTESHSLAKIQHLEELVFELEANERKLKRQLQESQDNEEDLKRRLRLVEDSYSSQDEDQFSKLLSEASKISRGQRLSPCSDATELQKHISDVEKAERRLRLKLDQIMIQEAGGNFEEEQSPLPVDQPEAVLRHKVQEMEVMQKHLKYEVVELERDCAELDTITRKDKSLIHELKLKVMHLEEIEKNLKEQLSTMEEADKTLSIKVDDLQEEIKRMQNTEKQLRLQLAKAESKETTLSMQLEHAREDIESAETKYKQKLNELEKEKKQLINKVNEVTNELGDLHGIELSLKQKVRNMENTEVTLKNRIAELENELKSSKKRVEELESLNETVSQKIHKLEEEKSSMMFEMSDLVVLNNRNSEELQDRLKCLQAENKLLKEASQQEHDEEIAKLKKEINRLSSLSRAHEVLKSNHADTKRQLKEMEKQLNKQNTTVIQTPVTKSKCIQVKLSDSYSIHDLEPVKCLWCLEFDPEFRNALRNLGAHHPQAYHKFVKALQPPKGKSRSVVRVTGETVSPTANPSSPPPPPSDPHHGNVKSNMNGGKITEDLVIARRHVGEKTTLANGTVRAQVDHNHKKLLDDLINALPFDDIELGSAIGDDDDDYNDADACVDETPVSKGGQVQKGNTDKNIDPALKKHYIGQLVDALLLPDMEQHTEDPLWKVVETTDLEEEERPYWAEVEVSPVDVMTLSLDVWGMTTDESGSETSSAPCHQKGLPSDVPSMASDTSLPPLPASVPPANQPRNSSVESYYLPNGDGHHADDSADEAPDIVDEDDGLKPLKEYPRAKSAERDSDFSEESFLHGALHRRKKREHQLAGSLESIQDSGTGSMNEDYMIKSMKERIAELEAKLQNENQSSDVRSKDILMSDCTNLKKDNLHLKAQLDEKTEELKYKTKEIEKLTQELKHLQTDLANTQQNNKLDKKSLVTAEDQLNKFKEMEKSYTQLQQKYKELTTEHEELKERFVGLKEASEEVVNKKKLITELQTKLSNYNKLALELQSSEKKVKALEEKLKEMGRIETSITRQNVKLLHDVDSLQQLVTHYHVMEEQYTKIRSKFDEAVQVRSKALTMIAPLRAKVMRLASKCKSKDDIIRHLLMDIRRCGRHSELATKAERVIESSAIEDYDRPISPVTLRMIQGFEKDVKERDLDITADVNCKPSEAVTRMRRGSGPSQQIQKSCVRDIEALLDHDIKCNNQNKTRQLFQRSLSTDNLYKSSSSDKPAVADIAAVPPQLSLPPVTQLDSATDYLSTTPPIRNQTAERSSPKQSQSSVASDPCIFLAVNDYNPELFSTSGQKELELPLHEGDLVRVIGPKNGRGYYEAEVKGRVGLVPALYLVPAPSNQVSQKTKSFQPSCDVMNSSPEHILSTYAELAQSHKPNYSAASNSRPPEMHTPSRKPSGSGSSSLVHPAFTKSPAITPKTPLSPTFVAHPAFHHGNQSPTTTNTPSASFTASRRFFPLKILCCPTPSRSNSDVVLSPSHKSYIRLQSPPPVDHIKSLQKALPVLGPPDPPSDFHVQRIVGDHSVLLSWLPPVMDEFARSNGITIKGYKIYINNKDVQFIPSAHMSKAFIENLHLHHGPTTFSIQSIGENSQSSRLVDSICIDNAVADHQSEVDYSQDMSSLKSSRHSEGGEKKRMCFAVYDYEPSKQSANPCPSQELALKTGDVVITYGNERDDGFYYGKVHGKKGLVPASFIEEVPVFTYKNRRSTSSNASQASSLLSLAGSTAGSSHSSMATSERSRPSSNQSNHSASSNGSRIRLGRKFEAVV